jgi:hypothetical protein
MLALYILGKGLKGGVGSFETSRYEDEKCTVYSGMVCRLTKAYSRLKVVSVRLHEIHDQVPLQPVLAVY